MTATGKSLIICALIVLAGYAACSIAYPTLHIRYKLTVNIKDRGVIKTGSGVVDIEYKIGTDIFDNLGGRVRGKMRGNAITVDLGADGLIFIVDRPNSSSFFAKSFAPADLSSLPIDIFKPRIDSCKGTSSCLKNQVVKILQDTPPPVEVPAEAMPAMVRFRNIQDPKSIEKLDPEALEKTFGSGVCFDSAAMELTDEPLTPAPTDWPEWLKTGDPDREVVSSTVHYPAPRWREDLRGLRVHDFRGL